MVGPPGSLTMTVFTFRARAFFFTKKTSNAWKAGKEHVEINNYGLLSNVSGYAQGRGRTAFTGQ